MEMIHITPATVSVLTKQNATKAEKLSSRACKEQ